MTDHTNEPHEEPRDELAYEPPAAEDVDTEITPAATSAAIPAVSQA